MWRFRRGQAIRKYVQRQFHFSERCRYLNALHGTADTLEHLMRNGDPLGYGVLL